MKRYKIFIIPHAGGSVVSYVQLRLKLQQFCDVTIIELPGRGQKSGEPCLENFEDAVNNVYYQIKNQIFQNNLRIILFGHSLGSWIAYETCLLLQQKVNGCVSHLICSGNVSPLQNKRKLRISELTDDRFIEYLKKLDATYNAFTNDKELCNIFLPIIRSDMKIADSYKSSGGKVNCDLTIMAGIEDPVIDKAELCEWKNYTNASFNLELFSGGHFYLFSQLDEVVLRIVKSFN